jgi:hypothetical protein
VSKKPAASFPDIEAAVKKLLGEATGFEERKQAIDTAMKFEALKLKARPDGFGKGFDQTGGDEDEDF